MPSHTVCEHHAQALPQRHTESDPRPSSCAHQHGSHESVLGPTMRHSCRPYTLVAGNSGTHTQHFSQRLPHPTLLLRRRLTTCTLLQTALTPSLLIKQSTRYRTIRTVRPTPSRDTPRRLNAAVRTPWRAPQNNAAVPARLLTAPVFEYQEKTPKRNKSHAAEHTLQTHG